MLIMAKPHPDELGLGHAGRIAFLNGIPSFSALLRYTLGSAQDHRKRNEDRQQLLYFSEQLAMHPEQYLARHTLIPFHYAYPGQKHSELTYQPLIRRWLKPADGPLLKAARACQQCVEEKKIGWWQRQHQLPGVDICIKHKTPLLRTEGTDGFLLPPEYHFLHVAPTRESTPSWDHPTVTRYHEFATWLLSQPERISPKELIPPVKTRCEALGITRDIKKKAPDSSLSRHIKTQFPVDWLEKHYPALLSPSYQGRHLEIDAAFFGQGASGQAIAMILAALFEGVDHLRQVTVEVEIASKPDAELLSDDPFKSIAAFVRIFVEASGNVSHMARHLKCSSRTAYKYRERYGLPTAAGVPAAERHFVLERLSYASPAELKAWGGAMKNQWEKQGGMGLPGEDWRTFAKILANNFG
ncbi:TniQ family protein [Vogesella sp. LIG4]|uniref:TniQ family protein n=1 Tax=Vogesella sp. LIG4 TaxID=1192162 RepID=UPI0008201A58|nr:TniQ family protein [Vogesella sp. LIG4]SCK14371.1 TniQ protein [Vogesella sp. LIG4]